MKKLPKKPKYSNGKIVPITTIVAILTERILKILEILDTDLDTDIKHKMMKRELETARYEGFKACQLIKREELGKRTEAYIYKPKWGILRGRIK